MNAGAPIASSSSQAQCLVDRDQVEAVLAAAVPGGQIEGHAPRHVRIERCWPGRSGDISFEWSFDLAPGTRQVLHGQLLDSVPDSPDGLRAATPVIRDGLLLNVFADLPQWRLRVHSLDRDPRLTHLAKDGSTHRHPYSRRGGGPETSAGGRGGQADFLPGGSQGHAGLPEPYSGCCLAVGGRKDLS
ncbi:MAG: hypothetical protein ACE5GE_11385 [Phycisphaerae bacterium]